MKERPNKYLEYLNDYYFHEVGYEKHESKINKQNGTYKPHIRNLRGIAFKLKSLINCISIVLYII